MIGRALSYLYEPCQHKKLIILQENNNNNFGDLILLPPTNIARVPNEVKISRQVWKNMKNICI